MEVLKDYIFFFYNLFFNQNLKNNFYIDKFIKSLDYFYSIAQNNLLFINLFILILVIIFYLNFKKNNNFKLIFILNFLIFLIIIILFPANIPFTDSYNEINYLFNNSFFSYLFYRDDGYFFVTFRFLHYVIFKFFHLNYSLIAYLNFALFTLSFFFIVEYLKKKNLKNFIFFFILIFFNGKWLVIIYEPVNIVWTITFILILIFIYFHDKNNFSSKNLVLFFICLFSLINFKAGIILIIYFIIYVIISNKNILNKNNFYNIFLLFLFSGITSVIIFNNLFKLDIYSIFNKINYPRLIFNFFTLHTLALTPFIFPIKYFSIIFALIQYYYIINTTFLKKNNFYINFKNFFINNPFIVIGSLGCLLIAIFRDDYNQSRYIIFSLVFQIGFLVFYFKNNFLKKNLEILKSKIIIFIFLGIYLINLFFPNQGLLFALGKNYIYNTVKQCLIIKQTSVNCLPDMFYLTFYDINKNNYKIYKDSIYKLKNLNLSIFYDINVN